MRKLIVMLFSILFIQSLVAKPEQIDSFDITTRTFSKLGTYVDYNWKGICTWIRYRNFPKPPTFAVTQIYDYYAPDLVVTVFNNKGDNPWFEADSLYEGLTYDTSGSLIEKIIPKLFNYKLKDIKQGSGKIQDRFGVNSGASIVRKEVDVIGHPASIAGYLPIVTLPSNTTILYPYYLSYQDIPGKLGIELSKPESYVLWNYFIGSATNHWGYEFPRDMSIILNNDYKASFVLAARAADIVTNSNFGHTVTSVSNSCGQNCRVANVVYDPGEEKVKWQMIYPKNKEVKLGQAESVMSGSMGSEYYNKGDGNYIFVVWRRYQGCSDIPKHKLYSATKKYSPTIKR